MKRKVIEISEISDFNNIVIAAFLAAKGKRKRFTVASFFNDFEKNVYRLGDDVNNGKAPYGRYETFTIHDPKQRIIHAACFEDRIVHHALIRHLGPVLDKALVPSTFACRKGKGNIAAIERVQKGLRGYPWFVKLDIFHFFASIDHAVLLAMLEQRVKGSCLDLLNSVVNSFSNVEGKGLPIGSLTSQHFANFYLNIFDRFLLEKLGAKCHVRYMDDVVWWCRSGSEAKSTLKAADAFLYDYLRLQCNNNAVQINKSAYGITFCGYRVLPGEIRLTQRKRRRYSQLRAKNERAYVRGEISNLQLQKLYASLSAIMNQASSFYWRTNEHLINGVIDA